MANLLSSGESRRLFPARFTAKNYELLSCHFVASEPIRSLHRLRTCSVLGGRLGSIIPSDTGLGRSCPGGWCKSGSGVSRSGGLNTRPLHGGLSISSVYRHPPHRHRLAFPRTVPDYGVFPRRVPRKPASAHARAAPETRMTNGGTSAHSRYDFTISLLSSRMRVSWNSSIVGVFKQRSTNFGFPGRMASFPRTSNGPIMKDNAAPTCTCVT